MNCKNCGAPVDGHIACPKCGQLVDFTGSMSTPQPRSNYGISWGNEEPKIEEVNATPVEPVEKIETPVEEKVVVPVVEEKKEEPRLDTSEPASERLSIFDTFSEALNDIAEDMVEISDEIKSDLADEPEPYTYKENKYEFSGNSNSIEPDRNALDDIADKLKASESAPLIIVFGVMGLIAIICFAVGSTGSHDYTQTIPFAT